MGAPAVPTGPFTANWWRESACVTVKMQSTASVYQGVSQLTVQTDPDSQLALLMGASTAGPDVLKQFNHFAADHVAVTT